MTDEADIPDDQLPEDDAPADPPTNGDGEPLLVTPLPGGGTITVIDIPPPAPPAPSPTKPYIDAVDAELDRVSRLHGYDGIVSACSYAGAPNFFQGESIAFLEWRSACWVHCHQVLAAVQAEQRPVPTPDDLVAELPALVLPN